MKPTKFEIDVGNQRRIDMKPILNSNKINDVYFNDKFCNKIV